MPFDGSGTFDRVHNFSADASAGIQAQATRFDAELDGMATGLENCQTLTGETTPTANSPMGGFKHTGVAAATSTDNYLRADQSSNQVGIYVRDTNTGVTGTISASAAVFPTAFTDGQRVTVKVSADGSTSAPRAIVINGLSANILDNRGSALPASKMLKDGIFELVYDVSASAFRSITSRNDLDYDLASQAEVDAGTNAVKLVTPSTMALRPGNIESKGLTADQAITSSTTEIAITDLAGFTVKAAGRYAGKLHLGYNQNTGDLKLTLDYDQVQQDSGFAYLFAIDTAETEHREMTTSILTNFSVTTLADTADALVVLDFQFHAHASTDGLLGVTFAQVSAVANATTLREGSHMELWQTDT